jgi:hypothetical protein
MTITIDTSNRIAIDHVQTGLAISQTQSGTVVYKPESRATGQVYEVIPMPNVRYSTAHDAPASGAAGRAQLEQDIRAVLAGK